MITYWCKFFDARGHVYGAEKMQAADDAAAIAKARIIHAHTIGSGYEIWDDRRLIHRVTFSAPKYAAN
jgi:hypothetical protein